MLAPFVQCGNSPTGSPGWVATARPFLLGSILFGYFVSAALFLTSARLMNRDILKLETVTKSGSLDAVRLLDLVPPMHALTVGVRLCLPCRRSCCSAGYRTGRLPNVALRQRESYACMCAAGQ